MSTFDETDRARIEIVTKLFAAWSSGDVDAPQQYMTDDAILWDSVGGLKEGWPAIREYFGHGLERYPDLDLVPTGEWWARPDGLALQWTMSATVIDDSMGGEKNFAEGLASAARALTE